MNSKFAPAVALATYIAVVKNQAAKLASIDDEIEKAKLSATMDGVEDFRSAWSDIEGVVKTREDAEKKIATTRTWATKTFVRTSDGKVERRPAGVEVNDENAFRLPPLVKPMKKRGRAAGENLDSALALLNSLSSL